MPTKRNAPAHKGEGAACHLNPDNRAYSTLDARIQYLSARYGLPLAYAATVAPMVFGEAYHG